MRSDLRLLGKCVDTVGLDSLQSFSNVINLGEKNNWIGNYLLRPNIKITLSSEKHVKLCQRIIKQNVYFNENHMLKYNLSFERNLSSLVLFMMKKWEQWWQNWGKLWASFLKIHTMSFIFENISTFQVILSIAHIPHYLML